MGGIPNLTRLHWPTAGGNPNEPIIRHVVDDSMKSVEKEPLVNLSEQKKNSHLNQKRAYYQIVNQKKKTYYKIVNQKL